MDKENTMTRRDALKTMGVAALSAAWAWTQCQNSASTQSFMPTKGFRTASASAPAQWQRVGLMMQ